VFSNHYEILDYISCFNNPERPAQTELTRNFHQMWLHRMMDDKNKAKNYINLFNWLQFKNKLKELPAAKKELPAAKKDLEQAESDPIKGCEIFNKDIHVLESRDDWGVEDDKHAMLYNLTQEGIPDSLRSEIWRELLKVRALERSVISAMKKNVFEKFHSYEDNLTPFQNLVSIQAKMECLAFRQIEEDMISFRQ